MIGVIVAFGIFAFAMSRSVKKYDEKMAKTRKKHRR
jgi:preprotein translocase subunit YajC